MVGYTFAYSILFEPKSTSPELVNPFNVGGVYVNWPLVLLYVIDPSPAAVPSLATDKSVSAMPDPPDPVTVIVLVAPVPEAVIPDPTKFKVVAAVDNVLPSSWIVRLEPPPPDASAAGAQVVPFHLSTWPDETPLVVTSFNPPSVVTPDPPPAVPRGLSLIIRIRTSSPTDAPDTRVIVVPLVV